MSKRLLLPIFLIIFTHSSFGQDNDRAIVSHSQEARGDSSGATRPNIVLFIADDLGVNDIGPYGNRVVKTPNLDKLSKESMVFKRVFAGSPTCGPSRSSLFTGLMPFRHGAHGNHSGVRDNTR